MEGQELELIVHNESTTKQTNERRKQKKANRKVRARKQKPKKKRDRVSKKRTRLSGESALLAPHVSSEVHEIALRLVAPELGALKWSNPYNSSPTFASTSFSRFDCPWTANQTARVNPMLPADQSLAIVFRNPLRAFVFYDPNLTNTQYSYAVYTNQQAAEYTPKKNKRVEEIKKAAMKKSVTSKSIKVLEDYEPPKKFGKHHKFGASPAKQDTFVLQATEPQFINMVYATSNVTYSPHGSTVYAGSVDREPDARYLWMDEGVDVELNVTQASGGAVNLTLTANAWTPGGAEEDAAVVTTSIPNNTATLVTLTIPSSAYYSFSVTSAATTTFTMNGLNYSGAADVWCHRCMPGFDQILTSFGAVRITAAAIMYSNNVSTAYSQGRIVGYQPPPGSHWMDYALQESWSGIANSQNSTVKKASNGMYGYLKPARLSDFDLKPSYSIANGVLVNSFYPIDSEDSFILLSPNIEPGTTPNAQDGFYTLRYAWEASTTNPIFDSEVSKIPSEVYEAALEMVRNAGQWKENPSHIADLVSNIKRVGGKVLGGVIRYGPKIVDVAQKLLPLFE